MIIPGTLRHHGLVTGGGRVAVLGLLALIVWPTLVAADTVRLKNGKIVEGDVIRQDDTQVTILVRGQPQFFSTAEVVSVSYSQLRFVPPPSASPDSEASQPVRIDSALWERAGERLRTFDGLVKQTHRIPAHLQWLDRDQAFREAQQAVRESLPTQHGRFSPLSALADLLILLGLRAPTIWFALFLVRELRPLMRIAEFLVVAYGVAMLLMALAVHAGGFWIQLLVFPFAVVCVAGLFVWMFAIGWRRAILALPLAVGLNLGIEYLLISAQLL